MIPAEPVRTSLNDLQPFGQQCERVTKAELAASARRVVGSAIDRSFGRFVDWLRSERYDFDGFENGPPKFAERRVYLRYDVHLIDLLAAYVLADIHEHLGIVGTFQITWKDSGYRKEIEPFFIKLLDFDRRFVRFGLHVAPTATWYLEEKLTGDYTKHVKDVASGDFSAWLLDLYLAYCRDGDDAPTLQEIRYGTDDALSRIAASFRDVFGEWKSISAHGNFLTNSFVKVQQLHPEIEVLRPYFNPTQYLAKWGVSRFGFDHEITAMGTDGLGFPRVLTEGASDTVRRRWYRGRVALGAGFVALTHPATWTCQRNSAFFLPEPVSVPTAEPLTAGPASSPNPGTG